MTWIEMALAAAKELGFRGEGAIRAAAIIVKHLPEAFATVVARADLRIAAIEEGDILAPKCTGCGCILSDEIVKGWEGISHDGPLWCEECPKMEPSHG